MKSHKLNHLNSCGFLIEFALLIISGFLLGCTAQKHTQQVFSTQNQFSNASPAININTASTDELEKLPHIGPTLAEKIVEYREKNGRFRKVEHLLLVEGISDNRFREIKSLVKAE